jgi:hypothetical protein
VTTWAAVARELRRYDSAVVVVRDDRGYPVSVRCAPAPDERTATFKVPIPDGLGIAVGPAWLLCHFHDERFWSLRSFGARGSLERAKGEWRFRPTAFVTGVGGIAAAVRMYVGARARAGRYLASRGLKPPEILWDQINAIKKEMAAERRNDSRTPRA